MCRLLCGLVLAAAAALPAAGSDRHVLVLGRITDDPAAHYEQLRPLLDYVVPRMADVGIREGRILMARDHQQMQSYLRRGRVDWVTETSASAMLLQQRAGAVPLLLTERTGVSHYRTVFFARRDSGIDSLDDLRGRSVAFQSRASTSAYFVPAVELLERRLPLEILLSPLDRPPVDTVGYLFARSEANISTWVHKRLVDVGAMSNLDWDNPRSTPHSYRHDLRILHQTPDYPRALEMVRGDLDPAVQARLREVLLEAADDPDAAEALLGFFQTTRFLALDAETARGLDYLRKAVARVSAEIE
ncbi:phosphate/phosphite/phosphonate ABC transporter substrate-binding protein [Luteimonas sp. SJ-92]|uniref:Phosphate/phosphite/phosphonate ABC transporter substrate-binding protein n=1 Tax=Luteimonas salinisoli TaxID=2752307 RepID=A0A853JFG6_9GAMM|nr:phosphate/phosphite/phosphonate ABC transporter substrate-binding protein [Luteimonas salinisoli]